MLLTKKRKKTYLIEKRRGGGDSAAQSGNTQRTACTAQTRVHVMTTSREKSRLQNSISMKSISIKVWAATLKNYPHHFSLIYKRWQVSKQASKRTNTHTHTHTNIYIYIYIYIHHSSHTCYFITRTHSTANYYDRHTTIFDTPSTLPSAHSTFTHTHTISWFPAFYFVMASIEFNVKTL